MIELLILIILGIIAAVFCKSIFRDIINFLEECKRYVDLVWRGQIDQYLVTRATDMKKKIAKIIKYDNQNLQKGKDSQHNSEFIKKKIEKSRLQFISIQADDISPYVELFATHWKLDLIHDRLCDLLKEEFLPETSWDPRKISSDKKYDHQKYSFAKAKFFDKNRKILGSYNEQASIEEKINCLASALRIINVDSSEKDNVQSIFADIKQDIMGIQSNFAPAMQSNFEKKFLKTFDEISFRDPKPSCKFIPKIKSGKLAEMKKYLQIYSKLYIEKDYQEQFAIEVIEKDEFSIFPALVMFFQQNPNACCDEYCLLSAQYVNEGNLIDEITQILHSYFYKKDKKTNQEIKRDTAEKKLDSITPYIKHYLSIAKIKEKYDKLNKELHQTIHNLVEGMHSLQRRFSTSPTHYYRSSMNSLISWDSTSSIHTVRYQPTTTKKTLQALQEAIFDTIHGNDIFSVKGKIANDFFKKIKGKLNFKFTPQERETLKNCEYKAGVFMRKEKKEKKQKAKDQDFIKTLLLTLYQKFTMNKDGNGEPDTKKLNEIYEPLRVNCEKIYGVSSEPAASTVVSDVVIQPLISEQDMSIVAQDTTQEVADEEKILINDPPANRDEIMDYITRTTKETQV